MEITKQLQDLYEIRKIELLLSKHKILDKLKKSEKEVFENAIKSKKDEVKNGVGKIKRNY